jgi:hypothetical protein
MDNERNPYIHEQAQAKVVDIKDLPSVEKCVKCGNVIAKNEAGYNTAEGLLCEDCFNNKQPA